MQAHNIINGFMNEEIIGQLVGVSEVFDQNGDRVSKNNKSCHSVAPGQHKKVLLCHVDLFYIGVVTTFWLI